MMKSRLTAIVVTLILAGLFVVAFQIQPVKAVDTIYIRADGSIDPPTAPIITADNRTYTLIGNIYSWDDGIVVEKDNIVLDGAGHTIRGPGPYPYAFGGIFLTNRANVTIRNTRVESFHMGIYFSSSSANRIVDNTITNNRDGIRLFYSSDTSVYGNTVTDNEYGVLLLYSSSTSIRHNTIAGNSWSGVELTSSSSNFLSGNTITTNNYYGIYLDSSSSYNNVTGNTVASNGEGILLRSSKNILSGNTITANDLYGVGLSASNNIIYGNTFTDDGLHVTSGSYQNSIGANTVNGRPLVYLEGLSIHVIADAGQVILVRCQAITVENLNLSRTAAGVELLETTNATISGNTITANNLYGIGLSFSGYNNVTGNTVASNGEGIHLDQSSDNLIQHNNFLNNNRQVDSPSGCTNHWDAGYPSGGNYWSDYTGDDTHCGPLQDLPGSDGLGDAAYYCHATGQDSYPLMEFWSSAPHDLSVLAVTLSKTIVGAGYATGANVTVVNRGICTETFNVTLRANTTRIETRRVVLSSGTSTTLSITWNTFSPTYGTYAVAAHADPVPGETDTVDNTFVYGWITVTIPGDVDGNRQVNIFDIVNIAGVYGVKHPDPRYDTHCDVDGDGDIDIFDLVLAAGHYGQSW